MTTVHLYMTVQAESNVVVEARLALPSLPSLYLRGTSTQVARTTATLRVDDHASGAAWCTACQRVFIRRLHRPPIAGEGFHKPPSLRSGPRRCLVALVTRVGLALLVPSTPPVREALEERCRPTSCFVRQGGTAPSVDT